MNFYAGLSGLMQLNLPNMGMRHRGIRRRSRVGARASTHLQVAPRHPASPACGASPLMPTEVDLRAAIESENAAIVALKSKIGEDPLRLLLQSALDTLSTRIEGVSHPDGGGADANAGGAEFLARTGLATRRTGSAAAARGRAGRDARYERPLSERALPARHRPRHVRRGRYRGPAAATDLPSPSRRDLRHPCRCRAGHRTCRLEGEHEDCRGC